MLRRLERRECWMDKCIYFMIKQKQKPHTEQHFKWELENIRSLPKADEERIWDQEKEGNLTNHQKAFLICEIEQFKEEMLSVGSCEHFFYFNCLHIYIRYKIEKFEDARCPHDDCSEIVDENNIFFHYYLLKRKRSTKK